MVVIIRVSKSGGSNLREWGGGRAKGQITIDIFINCREEAILNYKHNSIQQYFMRIIEASCNYILKLLSHAFNLTYVQITPSNLQEE
jgi:hypothetical protein